MIEHSYIEIISALLITKQLNFHRRKYLISCLRNLLFEYSVYEDKFVEKKVPLDIAKVLIDE